MSVNFQRYLKRKFPFTKQVPSRKDLASRRFFVLVVCVFWFCSGTVERSTIFTKNTRCIDCSLITVNVEF